MELWTSSEPLERSFTNANAFRNELLVLTATPNLLQKFFGWAYPHSATLWRTQCDLIVGHIFCCYTVYTAFRWPSLNPHTLPLFLVNRECNEGVFSAMSAHFRVRLPALFCSDWKLATISREVRVILHYNCSFRSLSFSTIRSLVCFSSPSSNALVHSDLGLLASLYTVV